MLAAKLPASMPATAPVRAGRVGASCRKAHSKAPRTGKDKATMLAEQQTSRRDAAWVQEEVRKRYSASQVSPYSLSRWGIRRWPVSLARRLL